MTQFGNALWRQPEAGGGVGCCCAKHSIIKKELVAEVEKSGLDIWVCREKVVRGYQWGGEG